MKKQIQTGWWPVRDSLFGEVTGYLHHITTKDESRVLVYVRNCKKETEEEFLKRMQIVANETEQPGSTSGGDGR